MIISILFIHSMVNSYIIDSLYLSILKLNILILYLIYNNFILYCIIYILILFSI